MFFDKETLQMDGSSTERIRNEAYEKKAMAVKRFKEGSLDGAKIHANVAKFIYPELPGLRRLNAVIDVLIGYEKKINGSVDWYAVLGVSPTDDIAKIRKRYRKLFLDMAMDDDDSLDITYKANKILTDSWKFLCNEKGKELYDKRRRYQLRFRKRQLRSLTFAPVVRPEPKPDMLDEHMIQLLFGFGGGERKREEPPSTSVPQGKQRRRIRRQKPPMRNIAPDGCEEVLNAFTKEELENSKNMVNTSKEVAVNGAVGSVSNVASDDDEAMKNLGMESNKDTHV